MLEVEVRQMTLVARERLLLAATHPDVQGNTEKTGQFNVILFI